MKINYLKRRGSVYWYQRRVPKALNHVLGTGLYSRSLGTKDLTEALKRSLEHSARFDDLLGEATPLKLYEGALAALKNPNRDPDVDFDPEVSGLLSSASPDELEEVWASLTEAQRAAYRAAQNIFMGRPRPAEYSVTLRSVLEEYLETRTDLPKKTKSRYVVSAESYLGQKEDLPLALLDRRSVISWLDRIKTTSASSRRTMVSNLRSVFSYAIDREHVDSSQSNPFNDHKFKSDTISYTAMDDTTLVEILDQIPVELRLPTIVARYSGMRLSEIFESELVTEEGILCFRVGATDTYRGAKTAAGNRLVPVRASLANEVTSSKPSWPNHNAYGKRFGRAKAKIVGPNRRDIAFHSLRVQFITNAGRAGWSEQQVAWLVGHEEGKGQTMSGQLYFRGYKIQTMRDIVESIPVFDF